MEGYLCVAYSVWCVKIEERLWRIMLNLLVKAKPAFGELSYVFPRQEHSSHKYMLRKMLLYHINKEKMYMQELGSTEEFVFN